MLGYMTKKEAIENGFTHSGHYYGIPVWIAPDKDFMVCTKWMPLEYIMSFFHVIEGFLRTILFPYDAPSFQFWVGESIIEEGIEEIEDEVEQEVFSDRNVLEYLVQKLDLKGRWLEDGSFWEERIGSWHKWNPFESAAQAFDLSLRFSIDVAFYEDVKVVECTYWDDCWYGDHDGTWQAVSEEFGKDSGVTKEQAVCRAIVLATFEHLNSLEY